MKRQLESAKITEIIEREGGDLIEFVHIFDLYEGEKIDPAKKALALRICYRSKERTLDGMEVNTMHESIIDKIRQETGGKLREG